MSRIESAPDKVGHRRGLRPNPGPSIVPDLNVSGEELAWQDQANCKGSNPDHFFPEVGGSTKKARTKCGGCVVRIACLEYAIEHNMQGIWGDTSELERRRIRQERYRDLNEKVG